MPRKVLELPVYGDEARDENAKDPRHFFLHNPIHFCRDRSASVARLHVGELLEERIKLRIFEIRVILAWSEVLSVEQLKYVLRIWIVDTPRPIGELMITLIHPLHEDIHGRELVFNLNADLSKFLSHEIAELPRFAIGRAY